MTQIKQVFSVGDRNFDTKAEAMDYLRRPLIEKAFNALTGDNKELTDWLIDQEDQIENAFDTGTIRRVTKTQKNQLAKALDRVVELYAGGEKTLAFLAEQAEGLKTSFKLPPVPRMTDEEKVVATKNTLMAATENNEELVNWLIANRDAILAGYKAGVEKRPVAPAATDALLVYRISQAEKKIAELEAGEQTDAVKADLAERRAKLEAMKAQVPAQAPALKTAETPAAEEGAEVQSEEQAAE